MARRNRGTVNFGSAGEEEAGDELAGADDPNSLSIADETGQVDDVHARLAHVREQLALAHHLMSTPSPDPESEEPSEDSGTEATVPPSRVHLHVKKSFRFISPPFKVGDTQHLGGERVIAEGDNFFDPHDPKDAAFLAHPYISRDLADGSIEHPDITRERLESAAKQAQQKADAHKALLADAKASLARFERNAQNSVITSREINDELNTPINQLRQG